MIDIKNPKNIYESLSSSILSIIDKLKIKTDDEKFEASKIEVLNLIDAFRQQKLDKAIEDLKNNQEWEKFTVAFYGETNAGKSTIIEALRIYFQEEEKIKQQSEFEKNTKEYEEDKKNLESKIESIKNDIYTTPKCQDNFFKMRPFTIPCQVTIGNKVTPQGIYPIFLQR